MTYTCTDGQDFGVDCWGIWTITCNGANPYVVKIFRLSFFEVNVSTQ
jgi:hypothetical protein